jgi:hypothetical protein
MAVSRIRLASVHFSTFGLGAQKLKWRDNADCVVLADPDGNRFCIVQKQADLPPLPSEESMSRLYGLGRVG